MSIGLTRGWILLVALAAALASAPAHAQWSPPGVDLSRPRVLCRAGDLPRLRERVEREPYRSWLQRIADQVASSAGWRLDDHSIPAEREKAKAAKNAAFLWALDRTIVNGVAAPFTSAAARAAMGARARELLRSMYGRSRIPAQFDDDINSSEELLQYATAYDLLAGTGHDFAGEEDAIRTKIVSLAAELYLHFTHPEILGSDPFTSTEQLVNNHLSKSASALGVAAIVLAEWAPRTLGPISIEDPALWMEWALERLDQVRRFTYVTGDGGYAEGPYYERYAAQNHLPFLRAWDRLMGDVEVTARGVRVPSLWRHPLFARTQRWMLDMTLPDGTLAALDDGNPGKSYYFALLQHLADGPLMTWAAARTATPWETEGSIDLAADAIAAFDDAVAPQAPHDGEARFWPEAGTAVLRSDWGCDAIAVIVSGEHGTALELGRERDGRGHVGSASHEHAEPGSFLMQAFGEDLVLDAGYLDFPLRDHVKDPERHSIVLVNGRGPADPFVASIVWGFQPGGFAGPPPQDGEASLVDSLDTGFADAVRVIARYGTPAARIDRRFVFLDHRTLVVLDEAAATPGGSRRFTWLVHGNGGGTSGGAFEPSASGARWSRARARVDVGFAASAGASVLGHALSNHEGPPRVLSTHEALQAQVDGTRVRSVSIVHPSPASSAPPSLRRLDLPGVAAVELVSDAEDRVVLAAHREARVPSIALAARGTALATDGVLVVADARRDGTLRAAWTEEATRLEAGAIALRGALGGRLGVAPAPGAAELVAANAARRVDVSGLGFVPRAADGACSLVTNGATTRLGTGRDGVVRLRAAAGNSAPAADPGETRRVETGAVVTLDARASCDLDGDALAAQWALLSAPAGSAWRLEDAHSTTPRLHVDRDGPFRVSLRVTDARGAESRPVELLLLAGSPCADGVDDDRDGLFDAADPRCAESASATECGLLGIETLPALALAGWLRRGAWARARARRRSRPDARRARRARRTGAAWIFLAVLLLPAAARADLDAEEDFSLEDAIEIVVLPREVQAVDGEGGGRLVERLEIGEIVRFDAARGRVGVVVTDRRLLAVSTRSGAWQSVRFRRGEAPPENVRLGGRVAVCATSKRAFGFDGGSGNLVESSLGPRESALDLVAGQNVGVIVTTRRALGISARAGGFFVADLHVGEEARSLSARASHATLETSDRLLTFRALRATWEEERPPRR